MLHVAAAHRDLVADLDAALTMRIVICGAGIDRDGTSPRCSPRSTT